MLGFLASTLNRWSNWPPEPPTTGDTLVEPFNQSLPPRHCYRRLMTGASLEQTIDVAASQGLAYLDSVTYFEALFKR